MTTSTPSRRPTRAFEMPDEPHDQAEWLERELVGMDLGHLVAELEAVNASKTARPSPPLETLLGDELASILEQGLGGIPRKSLQSLVRNPLRLLDLQERILIDGGPHWRELADREPLLASTARSLDQVWAGIERAVPSLAPSTTSKTMVTARPGARWTRVWATMATMAASMLAVLWGAERFLAWDQQRSDARGVAAGPDLTPSPVAQEHVWGWLTPGIFQGFEQPAPYLNHLADSAGDWFINEPKTVGDLARRLSEFRAGCSLLILAKHENLSPEDRDWLVERCRTWAAKIDSSIADLERGQPLDKLLQATDQMVEALVAALRERARMIG